MVVRERVEAAGLRFLLGLFWDIWGILGSDINECIFISDYHRGRHVVWLASVSIAIWAFALDC